jgi:hypothetical protein
LFTDQPKLYSSPDVIKVIRSRGMKWTDRAPSKCTRTVGRPKERNNYKGLDIDGGYIGMGIKGMRWKDEGWIFLVQDRDHW